MWQVRKEECFDNVQLLVLATPSKPNKSKWPELVGRKDVDAVKIIKKETGTCDIKYHFCRYSDFELGLTNVVVVPENSPITMDFRTDRIRVLVNKSGLVIRVPTIG